MSEDDHKITVETETVEAPVSGLLMSNADTNRPSSVKQNTVGGPGTIDPEYPIHDDSSGVPVLPNASLQANAGVAWDAQSVPMNNSKSGSNMQPSLIHEGISSSNTIPGTNINLIDHNPLSPHVTQTSLRNKKSSLLIDSTANGKSKKGKEAEEVPKHTMGGGKNDVGSVNAATMEDVHKDSDQHPLHNVSNNSSENGTATAAPLMLPGAAMTVDPKPPKRIERSNIPLISSREILLEDSRPLSNNHSNSGVNKNGALANGNENSSNLRQNVPPTHHGDEGAHDMESLNKPTKADFFAARLASAVGENEISDSEETFIYESAANSTKNTVAPILIDGQLDQQQHHHSGHGITAKMSVPVLNNNAKLLTRLKDTRHTSLSALPITASAKNATPTQYTTMSDANTNTIAPSLANTSTNATQTDDLRSMNSVNRQSSNNRQVDIQSVKSFVSEPRSPDKRLSLISLAKGNNPSNSNRIGNAAAGNSTSSRKPSVSNSTLRHVPASQPPVGRSKTIPNDSLGGSSNNGSGTGNIKRNLRTTASKIFDANGAPLRRYSGVPDDVNLEDYIEQSNGHLMTTKSSSIKRDDKLKSHMDNIHSNEFKRASHDLTDFEHRSAIQEEEGEHDNEDPDEDDMHSMFYYNHRGDLEARPQISDYDEDGEELEDDNHEDQYYGYPYSNEYTSGNNSNGNLNRRGRYFGSLPSVLQPNNFSNTNVGANATPIANEHTPLKAKDQFFRDQLGYSPHNFYTRKSSWAKIKHFIYFTFIVVSLLTVGFILGFLLATNKELQDFNIVIIDNILSSADELLFDITATAFNPGFFVLEVQYADLDIFAKSAYLEKYSGNSMDKPPSTETVRLGNVSKLETPLKFGGGFFKRNYDVAVSSIKLLNPGSKTDPLSDTEIVPSQQDKNHDAEKWKLLIKHEYDLIIRGNLKYKIPFFRSEKSIAVQGTVEVHPGKDDDDDDAEQKVENYAFSELL